MKRRTHKPKTSVENWTVSQVGCPDCAGVLKLTRDGRHGHHRYKCYVGHRFSTQSLLKAKEAQLEIALWSTLVLLAHIEMVCSNLIRERQSARASHTKPLQLRIREARVHEHKIRTVIESTHVCHVEEA